MLLYGMPVQASSEKCATDFGGFDGRVTIVTIANAGSPREHLVKPQPSRRFLTAHGLLVEPEELQIMVHHAITQLQESLYPPEPMADLTVAEAEALSDGGFDLSPRRDGEESPLARTTARYAALLGTSLTSRGCPRP